MITARTITARTITARTITTTDAMDVLHAWALAPATVGVCCVAADRGRARIPEFAAALLMLVAMLDAAVLGLVPPVWWAAVLGAGGVALAAHRGGRRERRPQTHPGTGMTVMSALGLVAMAALTVAMGSHAAAPGVHAHGGATAAPLVGALALGYCAAAVALAVRRAPTLDRLQYLAMGGATALMSVATLG